MEGVRQKVLGGALRGGEMSRRLEPRGIWALAQRICNGLLLDMASRKMWSPTVGVEEEE